MSDIPSFVKQIRKKMNEKSLVYYFVYKIFLLGSHHQTINKQMQYNNYIQYFISLQRHIDGLCIGFVNLGKIIVR